MRRSWLIPIPPSVNLSYVTVGDRVVLMGRPDRLLSEHYKQWLEQCSRCVNRTKRPFKPPSQVLIMVGECDTNRDLDNMFKGVLDMLVMFGWLQDDSIRFVTTKGISYQPERIPAWWCEVTITDDH